MNLGRIASGCAVLGLAACGGGDNASSPAATSVPAGAASTSGSSTSGVGDTLTVTGFLSLTLNETATSANTCTANAGGGASAILTFDTHTLQFFLPSGSTTLPAPAGTNAGVAFYNNNDATQQWSIGSGDTANAGGTATLSSDGKHGTVDVDLVPHPPKPNPSLKPIHVKGTFSCS